MGRIHDKMRELEAKRDALKAQLAESLDAEVQRDLTAQINALYAHLGALYKTSEADYDRLNPPKGV